MNALTALSESGGHAITTTPDEPREGKVGAPNVVRARGRSGDRQHLFVTHRRVLGPKEPDRLSICDVIVRRTDMDCNGLIRSLPCTDRRFPHVLVTAASRHSLRGFRCATDHIELHFNSSISQRSKAPQHRRIYSRGGVMCTHPAGRRLLRTPNHPAVTIGNRQRIQCETQPQADESPTV